MKILIKSLLYLKQFFYYLNAIWHSLEIRKSWNASLVIKKLQYSSRHASIISQSIQIQHDSLFNDILLDYFIRKSPHRLFIKLKTSVICNKNFKLCGPFDLPQNLLTFLQKSTLYHINDADKHIAICMCNDSNWQRNYFHWHIDFLLFLLRVKHQFDINCVIVLVNEKLSLFQFQSLLTLGICPENIKIFPSSNDFELQIPSVFLIEQNRLKLFHPNDYIDPYEIRMLASDIKNNIHVNLTKPIHGILISRQDAGTRRLLNESSLYDKILRHLGFKLVLMSEYDFISQVSLFSSADCIIAVHGAALTNLIYTSNSCVLEIFSMVHGVRPDYMQISRAVDCSYTSYVDPLKRENSDVFLPEHVLHDFLEKNSFYSP